MMINTFTKVMDLSFIPENLCSLSCKELFLQLEAAIEDFLFIKDGKISAKQPPEGIRPISIFAALYNECMRRGYNREEVGKIFRIISAQKEFFRPFLDKSQNMPEYKKFERLVGKMFKAFYPDAEIKINEFKIDKSDTERELDVSIRIENLFLLVECKDYSKKVSIDKVESFITKCRDLDVNVGIMVSSSVYQSGSLNKAKLHSIKLLTLQEAEKIDWRTWKTIKRNFTLLCPIPSAIDFTPKLKPEEANLIHTLNFKDFLESYQIETEGKISELKLLTASAIQKVAEQCISLPCTIDFPFEEKAYLVAKTIDFKRQVEIIHVEFKNNQLIDREGIIEIPIGPIYNLKDVLNGEELKIDEFTLPPFNP